MQKNNKKNLTIIILILLLIVIISLFLSKNNKTMQKENNGFVERNRILQGGQADREGDSSEVIVKNGFNPQ